MPTQDQRLAAIAAAAAAVLRRTPYYDVRAEEVAAKVSLPAGGERRQRRGPTRRAGRSQVWLYNEVRSRRVLVALAAAHAWQEFRSGRPWPVPTPGTVGQARQAVTAALREVVAFHHAEPFLMSQVRLGIGDIATWEKRSRSNAAKTATAAAASSATGSHRPATPDLTPRWPPGSWGEVAAAAWQGQCAVFAGFLAPVLRAATQAVTYLPEQAERRIAQHLSDLAFHACLSSAAGVDRAGLAERQLDGRTEDPVSGLAEGLAAYWLEHDLIPLAGAWVRELHGGELSLTATARRGTDLRAETAARAALARVLLEAGTLHRRSTAEGIRLVADLERLCGLSGDALPPPGGSGSSRTDLESLCDAASRLGLAAMRWGDLDEAERAFQRSRELAQDHLQGDTSRRTRADTQLAELACAAGAPGHGLQLAEKVRIDRRTLREERADDASWRRLTLTEHARVLAAAAAGQVVDAVELAERLLAERRARLGDDHSGVATARLALGWVLLEAGQPLEARHQLEVAHRARAASLVPGGFRGQEDLVLLARTALSLGDAGQAIALLAAAPARSDWFAQNVSFRLGFDARRWYALAIAEQGGPESPLALLRHDRRRLIAAHPLPSADPLLLSYDRDIALRLLGAGQVEEAAALLREVHDREAPLEAGLPSRALTLQRLARCARLLGDAALAASCYGAVQELTRHGVSAPHPLLLAARIDEAAAQADAGRLDAARELLRPVLDRTPLAHGRPALGDGHVLLTSARELQRRIAPNAPTEEQPPWWDETMP